MDKFDKRKTCVMLAEYMIAAQEMIERAETRRDRMIAHTCRPTVSPGKHRPDSRAIRTGS